jgi:hypothetical protein
MQIQNLITELRCKDDMNRLEVKCALMILDLGYFSLKTPMRRCLMLDE